MQEIWNVIEYGTFITTYSSPISSSVGKGMIVKGHQIVTFTAQDIGSYDEEGNLLLKSAMNFESDDPEKTKINGKMGLYIYWKSNNKTDWSKLWLWDKNHSTWFFTHNHWARITVYSAHTFFRKSKPVIIFHPLANIVIAKL